MKAVCRTRVSLLKQRWERREPMMRTYGIFTLNGKDNPLPLQQPYFVYFYTNHNAPSITLIDMGDFHGNSRTPFHLNSDAQFPCQAEINVLVTGDKFRISLRYVACAKVSGGVQWSALPHHCSPQHDLLLHSSSLSFFCLVSTIFSCIVHFLCLTSHVTILLLLWGVIQRERELTVPG